MNTNNVSNLEFNITSELPEPVGLCWEVRNTTSFLTHHTILPTDYYQIVFPFKGSILIEGIPFAVSKPFAVPILAAKKSIVMNPRTSVFGVHLSPYIGSLLFKQAPALLVRNANLIQPGASPDFLISLKHAIQKAIEFDQRVAIVHQHISSFMKDIDEEDFYIVERLHHFMKIDERFKLREVAPLLNYSDRWLQLTHKKITGLTISEMKRVFRFNKFLLNIYKSGKCNPRAALDSGYYDQAHAIHDFKKFAGLTPGDLGSKLPPLSRVLNARL